MSKHLYWYVVYWRNKKFLRTRFKPNKLGSVFGVSEEYKDECRKGVDKTGDFKIVEKYSFLGRMTRAEFKKWIADDRG